MASEGYLGEGSASRQPDLPDYYEVLQVSHAAQPLIVTKAYRLLAAFYHPDNQESADPEAFRQVVEAYQVLSDPVRRAAYDRQKFATPSTLSSNGRTQLREVASERCAEDEQQLRRQLLLALYNARRTQPHRPSLPMMVIPDLFGCSIDEAQFTLWYLRGKKFIEMTDEGMAITVTGVDYVEGSEFAVESPNISTPSLVARRFMLDAGD
jgi:curved DNA-binding protein